MASARRALGAGAQPLTAGATGLLVGVLVSLLLLPTPITKATASNPDGGGLSLTPSASPGQSAGTPSSGVRGGVPSGAASGLASPGTVHTTGPSTVPTHGVPRGQVLRVGVPVPDFSALKALGAAYDPGPVEQQFNSVLASWRRRHLMPLAGHDVQLVYRSFTIGDSSSERAACTSLVDDDHVSVVLPLYLFVDGARCTAAEKHVPTISGDMFSQSDLQGAAPYLYTYAPELGRVFRTTADWLISNGLAKGHRIGLYYPADPAEDASLIRKNLVDRLKAQGIQLAAEVTTSDGIAGGPTDAIAVQKFHSANVDVALLIVSPLAKTNFMHAAEQQRYFPTYTTDEYATDTLTSTAASYPPKSFDGSWAVTSYRAGDIEVGKVVPQAAACLADYHATTRRRPDVHGLELASVLTACDLMELFREGAVATSGQAWSAGAFTTGLQGIRGRALAFAESITFGPNKYAGMDSRRTMRWHADCTCWHPSGGYSPLSP
jgi:hypothetical protein